MATSTRNTKRRRHAVSAKRLVVSAAARHKVGQIEGTNDAADRVDTTLSASLERDVDSEEATQLEAIFEEPSRVDDAVIDDPDRTPRARRR